MADHLNDLQVCHQSAPVMNVLIILMILLKERNRERKKYIDI
jgi:hypothetical protein